MTSNLGVISLAPRGVGSSRFLLLRGHGPLSKGSIGADWDPHLAGPKRGVFGRHLAIFGLLGPLCGSQSPRCGEPMRSCQPKALIWFLPQVHVLTFSRPAPGWANQGVTFGLFESNARYAKMALSGNPRPSRDGVGYISLAGVQTIVLWEAHDIGLYPKKSKY